MEVKYSSFFNSEIIITQDYSAVTMICAEPKSKCGGKSQPTSRHAQLIIEKINKNGALHRFIMELEGPSSSRRRNEALNGCTTNAVVYSNGAIIHVHDKSLNQVRYSHKSETWRQKADVVEKMINQAKNEMDNPLAYPNAFSIFGSKSIFSSQVSTYQTDHPFLKQLLLVNKSLFKFLYKTSKATIEKYGKKMLKNPAFIPYTTFFSGECGVNVVSNAIYLASHSSGAFIGTKTVYSGKGNERTENVYEILSKTIGEQTVSEIESFLKLAKNNEERKNIIDRIKEKYKKQAEESDFKEMSAWDILNNKIMRLKIDSLIKKQEWEIKFAEKTLNSIFEETNEYAEIFKKYFDKTPVIIENKNVSQEMLDSFKGDYIALYRKTLRIVAKHSDLKYLQPHNCFTWAREKLKMIGVKIKEKKSEKYWANTRDYLTPKNEKK